MSTPLVGSSHTNVPVAFRTRSRKKQTAATLIQKNFRGHQVRKAILTACSLSDCSALCKKALDPSAPKMPAAQAGKTQVFLPTESTGIVLKHSGRQDAITRFHQMQDVRQHVNSLGCSHLVIPSARLCGEFLIEKRLPISGCSYQNMQVYLENLSSFNDAVKEMTRLFSKIYLDDLVTGQTNPWGRHLVRYDNLPLFLETTGSNTVGKIGLIDLEHVTEYQHERAVPTLVKLFPYHKEIILEEAERLGMLIDHEKVDQAEQEGQKYLELGYQKYADWLEARNAVCIPTSFDLDLSKERLSAIHAAVENTLVEINQGKNDVFLQKGDRISKPDSDLFEGDLEETKSELAACITKTVIDNLTREVQKHLSKIDQSEQEDSESSLEAAKAVMARSIVLKRPRLEDKLLENISKYLADGLDADNYFHKKYKSLDYAGHKLTCTVMQELASGEEIFLFDPAFYTCAYDSCWVRI